MKIREIENSFLAKILGYNITLYPFIFYIGVPHKHTKTHEHVHIAQIENLGWIKFYTTYLGYYIKNRFKGMNSFQAYMNIPYEIEAYSKEFENGIN